MILGNFLLFEWAITSFTKLLFFWDCTAFNIKDRLVELSHKLTVGTNLTVGNKLTVTGITESTSFNATSDRRKKENICVLENPLEKICQIRGVSFTFIDDKDEHKQKHAGIIAQEVQPIIPELINTTDDDRWSANYDGLTPYLIESVKTLSKENEELKEKVNTLETKIEMIMKHLNL